MLLHCQVLSLMQFVWGPQVHSSSAQQGSRAIHLSDSIISDDKLLARFMSEGLQHLQVGLARC
jgi:hypothetical protein